MQHARGDPVRRIVVSEFVSLDGVMEGPGPDDPYQHAGWTFGFPDPEGMQYKLDEVMAHDVLLLGRLTYEGFAAAWPGRQDEVGFADKMNGMEKYVVSGTLQRAEWSNSSVISLEAVAALKQEPGGDILIAGSRLLVQALLAHSLIDEIRLMVFPIVLGTGKRLFGDASCPLALKLLDSRPLGSGTLVLTYGPATT